MSARLIPMLMVGALALARGAAAQAPQMPASLASRFMDAANGLTLEQAIARALEQEPSLHAARSEADVARAMRLQAGLRPNPTVSFEHREEPAGTDNQTMVSIEWPLDLFRRTGRVSVAEREVTAAEVAISDRERLLAVDVRMRYGEVLAVIRELRLLDDLVATTTRQQDLLRARVEQGSTPPLERDLLIVEARRLESDRLLLGGRAEAAMFELKRVLGMEPSVPLTLRDTLEEMVEQSSASVPAADQTAASETRADVREAEARLAIADAKIDRAQREGRPEVSLFGSYARMNARFPQFGISAAGSPERVGGLFHYVAGGAMVTVPLLNRNQGEIAAARAERAAAAAARTAAQLTAQMEIAAALARDRTAHEAVRVFATGAQPLARQNLDVVSQTYELGRVTVFDVLSEQRRFLDIERAYTDALRAAYEARTALTRALGGTR